MPQSRVGARGQRFSYVETPVDMQEPQIGSDRFASSHPAIPEQDTPIEGLDGYHIQTRESFPQSAYSVPYPSNMNTGASPPQRPERIASPYGVPEPQGIHPAYYAPVSSQTPYSDPRSRPDTTSPPQNSYHESRSPEPQPVARPQRASTMPIQPESEEDKKNYMQPERIQVPYSPGRSSQPLSFNPTSMAGPNGMAPEMHQPGQVAHPNMQIGESTSSKGSWLHSLCECNADVGTCMTGIFCPCILDSKTAYRMGKKGEKKDPTDLLGFSSCNKRCGIFGVFGVCGLCCLFPLTLRTRIRHAYKLQGNFMSDVFHSCCCCCCVAIQNEREVRDREDRRRQNAGPAMQYRSDTGQGMIYAPGGGR